MTDYVSVTQAAALKGVIPRAIRKACEEGRIKATKVGRAYIIHREDLALWVPVKKGTAD